ncbi:unnamed protein product [Symbiodinium sp. KB8]|nr:unnamed protein product [Symbiodinium sp. KB8]
MMQMKTKKMTVVGSSDFSNAKLGDVVLRPVMLVSTKGTLMTDADCDSEEGEGEDERFLSHWKQVEVYMQGAI